MPEWFRLKYTTHKLEAEMKKIALFVLTALAVAALVLALSPVSAGAQSDAFPTGTYITTITYEDVAYLPVVFQELLMGEWQIIFYEDGSFEVSNQTTGKSTQGNYVVNPAVVAFPGGKPTDELSCRGAGVYKWTETGGYLTLSAVNDVCGGRYIVFTSHPLESQP
jgi:hypothetical protein